VFDQRKVEKMMQQMGMKMIDIDATEVVIKTPSKDIVIKNPQVSKVNVLGKETFQVVGNVIENNMKDEDIETIQKQTGCSRKEAENALEETGDLAKAIVKLKGG